MVRASRSMTKELLASKGPHPTDPDCCPLSVFASRSAPPATGSLVQFPAMRSTPSAGVPAPRRTVRDLLL